MDTAQDKLAFQVQFWGLIGPFIALITSFVILIKSPPEAIYLSIATIVGLIVSSKWKIKGALFSIGLMLLFYLYHFSEIDPNEHLWHIGMNLSIILGFAITAFSLQEVEELLHFGEKSILAEDAAIKEETAIKTDELTSYAALVETMRKEKILATRQHENLLQEFMNKQKELSHIQESLHAARQEIEELGKKPVEDLAALQLKEKEVELLKNELEALKAQKELPIKEVSNIDADAFFELKSTNELLSRERGRLESLLFRTQIDLHQKTEDLKNFPQLETEVEDLKAKLQELEKELAEETHKKEALFADLEEKEKLLNPQLETEVEDLKAKLQELEKELAEETHKKEALFADLEEKEKLLNQEIEAK
ncbi:MAG TPA: hypothetical protein PLC42_07660, partial [Parachlamydiaceae bacterium]|nr:hypothetical protein [Parachlamydiaceae bacterium]